MKKIYLAAAAILSAIAFSSCGSDALVKIDNPTNETITVTVDDKTFEVGPGELLKATGIKKGTHTMTCNGGSEMSFEMESNSVILNPTLNPIVIAREEYGVGNMSTRDFVVIEVNDEVYEGPFQLIQNTPCIDASKLNCDTATRFPTESVHDELYKAFRWDDFVRYYKAEYE